MTDATFVLLWAAVIWIAIEISGGGGGTRQRLQVPTV
jgi:hypothetical protein